jgi:hypothetical protein
MAAWTTFQKFSFLFWAVSSSASSSLIAVAMATPSSPDPLEKTTTTTTTHCDSNSSSANNKKTVYLIRHAETEENVRMMALHEVGRSLKAGHLPKKEDVQFGFNFLGMQLSGQTDSVLSPLGIRQVRQLHSYLLDLQNQQQSHNKKDVDKKNGENNRNWVHQIDLIAHSPLQRAKETCWGIFGLPHDGRVHSPETDPKLILSPVRLPFPPVEQLDCLQEVTPWETFTGGRRPVQRRIKELEKWIDGQNDDISTIALVGHSEYFQLMLEKSGMKKKPKNCDIWKATYHPGGKWSDLTLTHRLPITDTVVSEETSDGGTTNNS